MAQVKKKGKISLPPNQNLPTPEVKDEAAMQEMIARGGDVPKAVEQEKEDLLKSFTIKIYESELAKIRQLIKAAPQKGALSKYQPKKTKPMHAFIMEAVLEKITREEQM